MSAALRAEFIGKIRGAFGDSEYPEGEKLFTSDFYAESVGLTAAFSQQDWQGIPHETLFTYRIDLPYFTPAGLKYFLPAFLIYLLSDPIGADTFLDDVVFQLMPWTDELIRQQDAISQSIGSAPLLSSEKYAYLTNQLEIFRSLLNPTQRGIIFEILSQYSALFPEEWDAMWEPNRVRLKFAAEFWKSTGD